MNGERRYLLYADRKKLAATIAVSFIILTGLMYFTWNNSLKAEVKVENFSGEENIGYTNFDIKLENHGRDEIDPVFYIVTHTGRAPYILRTENNKTIRPDETAKFSVKTLDRVYIETRPSTRFTIIVKDRETRRFRERIVTTGEEYPETAYRNPNIRTYDSVPAGWTERFRGQVRDYNVKKNLTGVLIESEGGESDFGYFLTQKYNLTEKVSIEASFQKLENAEAGFRILESEDYPSSQNGLMTVNITGNMSSGAVDETYDTSQVYRSNGNISKGDTVQIQFFFDSEQSGPNWLYLDRLKAFNQ